MSAIFSDKKFAAFEFDESDEVSEEKSPWKSTRRRKNKSVFCDSAGDNYELLQLRGVEPKGKKLGNKPIIIPEVDEAVKERIFRSDAALQSSSSNYNPKISSGSRCPDPCISYRGRSFNTSRSLTAATNAKDSDSALRLRQADNELVSILSDEDNDDSLTLSSNGLVMAEGPSGEQIREHEFTSHETESSVVVCPECVTYGRNCYRKARLTFSCSSIKLDVSEEEEGPMDSLTFKWETMDLVSIESQWLDPFVTADVCLHIKSEHRIVAASAQKSGMSEVKFIVYDPCWSHTQERIKSLDAQYKEKWDIDLDSYESFEDVTYLEGDCDCISISKREIQLLQPERFINDTIVDFYIEYLKKKIKPADQRVHFFNSFFFRKLADFDENHLQLFDGEAAFRRVRKWTKRVNLFQKDYVFIPVNFSLHWSLIVICHPGEVVNFRDEELAKSSKVPCILHMDSIKGSHRGLEKCIRCYLWEEWKERTSDADEDTPSKFMNLQFLHLEVPQQQNSYDCGLFMLHYMELFVKQDPVNFNPLNNFIGKDWFHPKEASLKRARIKRLIFELGKSNSQKVASPAEFKDVNEEEAEVQFLHETCNLKETCHASNPDTGANMSRDVTPIMVKPLRSEPDLSSEPPRVNAKETDIILFDSQLQSDREGFEKMGENDENHGQMVLYDPSNVILSPIKETEETEEVFEQQLAIIETNAEPRETGSPVTCIDKSLKSLQLKEKHPSERSSSSSSSSSRDQVLEALVVEDSDECCSSSSDNVIETCVVKDSDSDGSDEVSFSCIRKKHGGNCSNVEALKRRRPVVSKTCKRRRRGSGSSSDLQVIFPCE